MFNLHDRFACFTFQPDDSALKTWKEAKENAERQVCRVEIYNKYFLYNVLFFVHHFNGILFFWPTVLHQIQQITVCVKPALKRLFRLLKLP